MRQQVTKSIIVTSDTADLYETWKDFPSHPQFMRYIKSVTPQGDETYRWVMAGPNDVEAEWITETTRLEPNKRIAWKTIEGDLKTSGQVTFTELSKGQAEITITMQTILQDEPLNEAASFLFKDEGAQLEKDLRSFRDFVETKKASA
ncbi:MAG: SRPBCC family protein [Chloroflexota bacterium]|jgi:uncharacterized membrane protein